MIIVSQDKDVIVNFDRTQNIWIDDDVLDKTNTSFDIVADEQTIGTYATEERAKEVLQEIIERYHVLKKNTVYAQGDSNFTFNEHYYYEMPKE